MLILTVRRVRSNLTPVGLQQPPGSNRLFRGSMCPAGWGHTQDCSSSPSLPSTLESQLESPNSATCKQQTDNGHGSQARQYIMSPAIQLSEYSPEAHSSRQTDACCHTGDTQVTPGNVWFIVFQSLMGLGRIHQAGLLPHISQKGRQWSFLHSGLTVPWKT